jgi:ribonuclease P protein component
MVSRRHSAKATERNGIKRCIREAFRLEQSRLEGMDVLIRPPLGARASAAMLARVRELFVRIAT